MTKMHSNFNKSNEKEANKASENQGQLPDLKSWEEPEMVQIKINNGATLTTTESFIFRNHS